MGRVEPAFNPFGPDKVLTMSPGRNKVLPMCPEWTVFFMARPRGFEISFSRREVLKSSAINSAFSLPACDPAWCGTVDKSFIGVPKRLLLFI